MGTVTVDFVARGDQPSTWLLVLVEGGPWAPADVDMRLRGLQHRLYECIQAALDGQVAERFPESLGGEIIIRVDGYDLPEEEVRDFFERFAGAVMLLPDYAEALSRSRYVDSISFELNLDHIKH